MTKNNYILYNEFLFKRCFFLRIEACFDFIFIFLFLLMFGGSATKDFSPATPARSVARRDVLFSSTFWMTQRERKLEHTKTQNDIFKAYTVIYLLLGRTDFCLSLTDVYRLRGLLSAYL